VAEPAARHLLFPVRPRRFDGQRVSRCPTRLSTPVSPRPRS
jgi:hypothetical protein